MNTKTNYFEMLKDDSLNDSSNGSENSEDDPSSKFHEDFTDFKAAENQEWITYSNKKLRSETDEKIVPKQTAEVKPSAETSKIDKIVEIHQPSDLESPFLVEIENDMKGDDLTKEDYDDIVNIIRQNIGEGALVNESDYISIQYMNDLVLVQAYIDKRMELQRAAESDSQGKINVNSRQDFPNFDPSKPTAGASKISGDLVSLDLAKKTSAVKEQSSKNQQESMVYLKGKKKGKRRIDDD